MKTDAFSFDLNDRARPPFRLANLVSCLLLSISILLLASGYRNDGGWMIGSTGKPVLSDFLNFYSAGKLVQRGQPDDAYVLERQQEVQQDLTGETDRKFLPWPYPPIALPMAHLLAIPSYEISFLIFAAGSLALCAVTASLIVGTPGAALWVAGSAFALSNVYIGQNGLMTASLFGLGLYLLPTRPIMAGILLGSLAFKPHLGLLLPLFLITLGAWRAFASAAATTLAAIVISLAIYGPESWLAFFQQLERVREFSTGTGHTVVHKIQSLHALLLRLDIANGPALVAHGVAALAATAVAIWVWRSDKPYAIKAALLLTVTGLISPYVFMYDLALLLIAQAFLIRHLLDRDGHLTNGTWLALLCLSLVTWAYAIVTWPLGLAATVLLGAILLLAARDKPVRPEAPLPAARWLAVRLGSTKRKELTLHQ